MTYTTEGDHVWSEPLAPVQFDDFGVVAVHRDVNERFVTVGNARVGDAAFEGTLVVDEHGIVVSDSELTDQLLISSAAVNEAGMFVLGESASNGSSITADAVLSARDGDGQLLGRLQLTGLRPPVAAGGPGISELAIVGTTVVATGPLQYAVDFGTGVIEDHGSSLDANGLWHPGMGDVFVVAYDWVVD